MKIVFEQLEQLDADIKAKQVADHIRNGSTLVACLKPSDPKVIDIVYRNVDSTYQSWGYYRD
jgi:hypothetical protein